MKIFEIGTGYTSIPAKMGAATEIVVEELTTSMLRLGYDATIVDIADKHRAATALPIVEVPMPQCLDSTDTTLGLAHKLKRVLYSISLAFALHKLIRRCGDSKITLHFHNQYNLFFFLKLTSKAMRKRLNIAYTVHSHVWFGKWDDIRDTVNKRYFQEIYCARHADHVFVLNDTARAMLTDKIGVDTNRVHKVINGVNMDKYNKLAPQPAKIVQFLENKGLDGKKIIFQVGSVCDRKNQLGSLRLLMPTLKSRSDVAFMYAGGIIDADYKRQIDDLAASNGVSAQVVYAGEVAPGAELNALYSASRASIFNSKSEAFSLVMLESMAASCPVFVCDSILNSLPSIKSAVGRGVFTIADTFGSDLEKMLDNDDVYATAQHEARSFAAKEYGWDVAAKQYLKYF